MIVAFFFNLVMAALIAAIHFAPQPVVLIAEFVGTTYGLIMTPILLFCGAVLMFSENKRKPHAQGITEMRKTWRFLTLQRALFRVGFILVIFAGVSVGWTTWATWLSVAFATLVVGMYVISVAADKVEEELKRLREENEALRAGQPTPSA